jgi:hypothetical protein
VALEAARAALDRRLHQGTRGVEYAYDLLFGHARQAPPRVDRGVPAALGLPHVPDARHDPLVEQRVAEPARGVVVAKAPEDLVAVQLVREDVRPQRRQPLVEPGPALGHQLEHGAVELDDVVLRRADHEPGAAGRAAPALTPAEDAPPAAHAEVRMQRQVAVEAQEQVLAPRVHGVDRAAREPLGPAVHRVTALRRLDRLDRLADEGGADAPRGRVDRVALRHGFSMYAT